MVPLLVMLLPKVSEVPAFTVKVREVECVKAELMVKLANAGVVVKT